MKPIDDADRRLAAVTADVIAMTVEDVGLPDAARGLASKHAIQLLARAYVELRDQLRKLHDLVDQTDPNDPIGTALTKVGLPLRPPDVATPREPRLVPTPAQVENMDGDQLTALYLRVMGDKFDFAKHETFVVRLWNGMDGCWTDCTGEVSRDEALRVWAKKTSGGAQNVSYAEIDYYAIFPGDTHMLWDGSKGKEMHR